ncbi:MAG: hypothetical protein IKQ89_07310, partial [Muribaculaceae bacterium]|nr:hypothetical protein [Muribaculaceae bacterium]
FNISSQHPLKSTQPKSRHTSRITSPRHNRGHQTPPVFFLKENCIFPADAVNLQYGMERKQKQAAQGRNT